MSCLFSSTFIVDDVSNVLVIVVIVISSITRNPGVWSNGSYHGGEVLARARAHTHAHTHTVEVLYFLHIQDALVRLLPPPPPPAPTLPLKPSESRGNIGGDGYVGGEELEALVEVLHFLHK